jgi:hypothetical protein
MLQCGLFRSNFALAIVALHFSCRFPEEPVSALLGSPSG